MLKMCPIILALCLIPGSPDYSQNYAGMALYTNKVPSYNSLKACKSNMFFLPLPLDKTLETLDGVEGSLANPELYIIVNRKPTKGNVVWRSVVDVNQVKVAISKLKQCNWLYKDISDESVDSAAKEVIEVLSNTSSTVLRDMNDKLSTKNDLEQYKMLSVQEEPLSSTQKHLDTMSVLFPDGNFGKYHPRKVPLSHSEYEKSRLWNKDCRFRKDPQYVFYLLKEESRELKAGVYNLLKTSKSIPTKVSNILQKVTASDQKLEANLSTMFQSVLVQEEG